MAVFPLGKGARTRIFEVLAIDKVCDDHAVIGLFPGEGSGANGNEFVGPINVIDPEKGKRPVKGISPARSSGGEYVGKFLPHDSVNGIVGWGVEISGNDGGELRVGSVFSQSGN